MKSLKSVLKFWQEIVFIIAAGLFLIYDVLNASVIFQHIGGIVISCIVLIFFICLVIQLFWKEAILGMVLAAIVASFSSLAILMYAIDSGDGPLYLHKEIILYCILVGLTATAISMLIKYIKANDPTGPAP